VGEPTLPDVVAAKTTAEEDRHSQGQRRINVIWEGTQAIIAVTVTGATLYVAAMLALKDAGQTAAFLLLSNAFFLVIGFYFGRTNHQRVGGVDVGR
jgi:Na+/phosphate symporter